MNDLKTIIETSLQKRFSNEIQKQYVSLSHDRLNFACPFCGDSTKSSSKKRANLYYETGSFHCYNCGHHSSQKKFLKDLVEMDWYTKKIPEDLLINSTYDNLSSSFNPATISTISTDLEDSVNKYGISREYFKNMFSCVEVHETKIEKYLNSRCIFNYDMFLYNDRTDKLILLNRDVNSEKIIAFQIRNFNNSNNKYLTYKLNTMYKELRREIPEDDNFLALDIISKYFNILNVNIKNTITYFEGPIDAYFYKNSISLTSIESKAIIETLNTQYLFDCDSRGQEEARLFLSQKKKVFLWRKFLKDINLEYPNTYEKMDFNDVIIHCKKNKLYPDFDKYFSNHPLDIMKI